MAQVISAIQEKGGVGKSTLLCALAARLAKDGAKVVIVDTDPQKTCLKWAEKDKCGVDAVEQLNDELLTKTVKHLKGSYDVVMIDTAGYKSAMAVHTVMRSDIIFIPCKAAEPDAKGALRTWQHVQSISESADIYPQTFVVLSDFDKGTSISEGIRDALATQGLITLNTPLWHRTGFKEMHTHGTLPPGSATAAINEFVAELQLAGALDFYREPKKEAVNG